MIAHLADGRTIHLTATQSVYETSPAWSPDGRRIVYDDERWIPSDSTGLRTMNPDGTGVAIVPGTRDDRDPQWSPDGTRLVVSSWDSSIQKFDLVTLAPDGSGRAALTHTPADEVDPDWQTLPGPRRSDYKNAREFCVAERDFFGLDEFERRYGGGRKAFHRASERTANPWSSRLSRLALAISIALIALAFVAPAHATFMGENGKLAFVRYHGNENGDIWTVNADGSGLTRLTNAEALPPDTGGDEDPRWSPDGRKILFEGATPTHLGGNGIYTMNADGSELTRLHDRGHATGCPTAACCSRR